MKLKPEERMSTTLNEFLKQLEDPQPQPEPIVSKTAETNVDELVKIIDERIKLAVGTGGHPPDTAAVPANPAVELPREPGPGPQATNAAVAQLIAQLTAGERMAGPQGYIATPAGIVAPATAQEIPVKTAEEEIVLNVYNRFFGGNQ